MIQDFDQLIMLWKNYNTASTLLTKAMGGTANEVGEFAERLACAYYQGEQLSASNKSADILSKDGKLIQVKSRKMSHLTTTSLNVIRSWGFDLLVVILFAKDGDILKGIEIDSDSAREIAKRSEHVNGLILTTSSKLLDHPKAKDITQELKAILNGKNENANFFSHKGFQSKSTIKSPSMSLESASDKTSPPSNIEQRRGEKMTGHRDDEIMKRLNAIGKSTFVEYYHVFKNYDDPIAKLPQHFTLKSRHSRTSKARSIFRDNQEVEALKIIINSGRLDPEIIEKAKVLLDTEMSQAKE
ncbi:MAG: hypothetical protein SCK57_12765 [Bacillota bacterium]|nr:hypothetical protein [Bacillota bacterium]MDW7678525.1 hypothetical protein [Bacillota bacterium]